MKRRSDFICNQCHHEFTITSESGVSVHSGPCPFCSSIDVRRLWCKNIHYHPTKGK